MISKAILLERIAVLILLLEALGSEEDYEESNQNLKNLLVYVHNNVLSIMEILRDEVYEEGSAKWRVVDTRLRTVRNNKKHGKAKQADKVGIIQKNNNIVFSILQLQIENSSKEQMGELERLLQDCDRMTIQQGTHVLMDTFQKIVSAGSPIPSSPSSAA